MVGDGQLGYCHLIDVPQHLLGLVNQVVGLRELFAQLYGDRISQATVGNLLVRECRMCLCSEALDNIPGLGQEKAEVRWRESCSLATASTS